MKATIAVAALAAGASAGSIRHRHAHSNLHLEKKEYDNSTCGCTTIYSTYYGEATLVFPSVPATSSSAAPETTMTSTEVVVPTPVPQSVSTTGVYTFPATTITLTDSTTVCGASSTAVPSGTHTLGGVTTIVSTATTVTCPYATVSTSEGVTTSVIETTTYVCPSAGTYTIAPTTTVVPADTTVTVPVVTSYPAGTYTQPEVVTTVTETSTVIYCPFDIPTTSSAVPVTTSTAAPVTSTAAPVTTYPVASTTTAELSSVYQSSTASATPSSGSGSGSGSIGGAAGAAWAVAYTPYETDEAGGCKTQSQIEADIAGIAASGISAIRVYSTDCNTLEYVGSACSSNGIKLILGIYIDAPGCDASNPSVSEQISSIKSWAQWDMVDLIVVGNEAVLHGYCTPAELSSLVSSCKSELSGYSGPYTTAETTNIWQQDDFTGAMCGVVDFVGANAHAFFNTETVAAQAGQFVKGQLDLIDNVCEGKTGVILETGWPSAGVALGAAVPGVAQQATAIKSIIEECGDKAVIFSLTSDAWKDGSTECQCEQHWGCAGVLGISL
ncbi:glycoside hydrolase family 17 protein [Xylariaceae sp. FL0016]|nr:glycoside hydrolase family 17 protein [Xylariaceae sp. FL0016]